MKNTRLLLAGLVGIALLAVLLLKSMVGSPPPAVQTVAQRMSGQSPLSRTDANGVTWGLDQAGGALDAMDPNGPKAGPPILVKTNVQRVADREVSVGLILEGQAGEQYRPVVKKNGTPVAAPRLRIVSETGQVVTQGDFQYGWGGTCRYSWRVPNDFTGKYQVQVDIDLGPIEVKHERPWHTL